MNYYNYNNRMINLEIIISATLTSFCDTVCWRRRSGYRRRNFHEFHDIL